MRSSGQIARLAAASLAAMLALGGGPVPLTFQVTSVLDQIDDDVSDGVCQTAAGTCTLRAAVMQANRAGGAGATIALPAGVYSLTRPVLGADGETEGDLNLTTPLTGSPPIAIAGAGAATTIIDANGLFRVLRVEDGRRAEISGVTLRNGFVTGSASGGGGVLNLGALEVAACVVSGNEAFAGGGIQSLGTTLVVTDSVVRNNRAQVGGGIAADSSGSTVITRSTLSDNEASSAAGLWVLSDTTLDASTVASNDAEILGGGIVVTNNSGLIVKNSTISQNDARGDGGGIYSNATVDVYSSSIVFNQADSDADPDGGIGGGIYNQGSLALRNSLVAGNFRAGAPVYDDCRSVAAVESYGRNYFTGAESIAACNVVAVTGFLGYFGSLTGLQPLAHNGGPTRTHAPRAGSNAIDGGDPVLGCVDENSQLLATDQRGEPRTVGAQCDVGAVEYGPAVFSDGFESGDAQSWSL